MPGLGIRCVDTNPWVTGAETCELVLALDALGDRDRALRLFADMQHLRDDGRRLLDRLGLPRGRELAGRAHDVHRRGGDPGRRRAAPTPRPGSEIMRGQLAGRAASAELALECGCPPSADRVAGAPPPSGVAPASSPSASTSSKPPPSSARRKTWYGGWPPSAGSGNTSWITSAPPAITQRAQPV